MMGVFIKGMEMPDSCIACMFGKETNYAGDFVEKCLINDKYGYVSIRKPRLETCPLVEIKEPHGDLTDREWVRDSINHSCWIEHNDYLEAIGIIDDAPTIIEPEGGE